MTNVRITAWKPGFKTISFMKLLREGSQAERSLAQAKALVDALLEGKPFTVEYPTQEEAEAFVRSASELGAVASVTNDPDLAPSAPANK